MKVDETTKGIIDHAKSKIIIELAEIKWTGLPPDVQVAGGQTINVRKENVEIPLT